MRRVLLVLAGLFTVGLALVAGNAGAQSADPLPPDWSSYDGDGTGVLSDGECAALSGVQASALREWINPEEGNTGIFQDGGPFGGDDGEARRWLGDHFENIHWELEDDSYLGEDHQDDCGRVQRNVPRAGGVGSAVGGVVDAAGDFVDRNNPLNAVKRGFEKVADQMADAYESLLETATTFWMGVPSTTAQSDQTISWLQDNSLMRTLTITVGIAAWCIAMVRVAMNDRGEGLRRAGFGLMRMLVVGAAGIAFVRLGLELGDQWSKDLVGEAAAGAPSEGLKTLLAADPGLMFMLAVIGIITSVVQIVMLIVRNAAVIVIAGAWQVTAAWSVSGDDTMWRRTSAWLAALVLYKPAAAVVYAAGFRLLHEDQSYGGEVLAAIQGMVLLGLAVLALPAMIRLVVPAASMGGPSTAGLMAAGAGAIATGAMFAGGSLSSLLGAGGGGTSATMGSGGGGGFAGAIPTGTMGVPGSGGGGGGFGGGDGGLAEGVTGAAGASGAGSAGSSGAAGAAGASGSSGAAAGAGAGAGGAAAAAAGPFGAVAAGISTAAQAAESVADGLATGPGESGGGGGPSGAPPSGPSSAPTPSSPPPSPPAPPPSSPSPPVSGGGPDGAAGSLPQVPEGETP